MKVFIRKKVEKQPRANLEAGTMLAVDPGLDGTGWAVFDKTRWKDAVPPIASGAYTPKGGAEWWRRAENIVEELERVVKEYDVRLVYVEEPQFMEGGKGIVAARGGSLVKLTILVGMVLGRLCPREGPHGVPVPVRDWKGSMPKEVSNARVREKLKRWRWQPSTGTTHELDAVGIGLYVKGAM